MLIKGFSKEHKYEPTWNANAELPISDRLIAKLSILSLGELLQVMEALQSVGFQSGEVSSLTAVQMQSVLETTGKVIAKHVSFEQGNANFDVNDVVAYSHFFALAIELLFQLVTISSPTEQDVKN